MAERLTPQQEMAVKNRGGKLLVSAAAGSGKTKVLVDRLLSYISDPDNPANIDDFLIITFTKAAATELRGKIASKISERIAEKPENRHLQQQLQRLYLAEISTVHSFCSNILREYAYQLDIPADFRIAEEKECQEIQLHVLNKVLDIAYETIGEDADFQTFIDTQGLGRDDYLIPQVILNTYDSAQCHLNPESWLTWCMEAYECSDTTDAAKTIWGQYLIENLRKYVLLQIRALEKCISLASQYTELTKPTTLLASTVDQLNRLAKCVSWDEVLICGEIDYGRLTFPKNFTDEDLINKIKYVRDTCKKGLALRLKAFADPSETIIRQLQQSASAVRGLIKLVRQFRKEYAKCKLSRRVLDYADLEHKTLELLLGKDRAHPTQIAKEISKRFCEIMVDEYQDTNEVQDAIFSVLTAEHNNCFMVGDVKQSIYQFRLADPGIFLEKYNSFVNAEKALPDEGRKVLLSSNFRSSGGVIGAVNHVFSNCMTPDVGGLYYGEEELLREGLSHVELPDPEVELYAVDVEEDTYSEEASFVANRIRTMLDEKQLVRNGEHLRPVTADDIVILLRSPGSTGAFFVYALEQKGIRCTTGKGIDLLQTDEVSTLRSLLQVISNPLQDIYLMSVLMSPVFGFTADELARMRSRDRYSSIYGLVSKDQTQKSVQFLQILTQLRQDARFYSLSQLIQRILVATNFDSIYGAKKDGVVRKANLQAFCQIASEFESTTKRNLEQFLAHLDLMEKDGLRVGVSEKEPGAVTIMSIHTSKGLEFPVVFLCGLSKRFNTESARERVLSDKDLGIGVCCTDATMRVRYPNIAKLAISKKLISDGISEEMRILYVAMTRARDRLIMTYASNKLAQDLSNYVVGLDMYDSALLTGYVTCSGAWVMQSALRKTESGALFALGGHPNCASFAEPLWSVKVVKGSVPAHLEAVPVVQSQAIIPADIVKIEKSLNFSYPYSLSVDAPSKLTATQLKGRLKDTEVSDGAAQLHVHRQIFRKPSFVESKNSVTNYGNAVHALMQYINFQTVATKKDVEAEIDRLRAEQLITPEQAALIDPSVILQFFQSDIGKKIAAAEHLLREFKFSVLDDASHYVSGLEGEKILLQGVVDCALLEDDGITVIDFKTDKVTNETLDTVSGFYRSQVEAYALALKKIFQLPIKSAWLYFFQMDCFVTVDCT